ncbi:hypothetical protein QFC21_005130 [Naganishia friedmannii]|uniref:Uncharacterized protein n=1 Tax=Naganishia friedmannii TaxID=89922 RepID=A0ACC2VE57_9TREE|nr:hypothetical protein QFC21_005130 [Naganishia friedmannii]
MQRSGATPVPEPSIAKHAAPFDPHRRITLAPGRPQDSKSFNGLLSDPEQSRSSSHESPSTATGTLLHVPARQKLLVQSVLGPICWALPSVASQVSSPPVQKPLTHVTPPGHSNEPEQAAPGATGVTSSVRVVESELPHKLLAGSNLRREDNIFKYQEQAWKRENVPPSHVSETPVEDPSVAVQDVPTSVQIPFEHESRRRLQS